MNYNIYVLVLCVIVFITLAALFTAFVTMIFRMKLKLVSCGAEDEKIKEEYRKNYRKKKLRVCDVCFKVVNAVLCVAIIAAAVFFASVNVSDNRVVGEVPMLKVVTSGSMAKKSEKNEYLFENNLNNQLNVFDVITLRKLPAESDLQLYDIVVYEVDDILLVHRIVGIEEPNEEHSERFFLLQGDAVERPDRFPVRYSQMKGIYRGERIKNIGSIVMFMQTPAGYLCLLLLIFALIISPVLEKKLLKHTKARLAACGFIDENGEIIDTLTPVAAAEIAPSQDFADNAEISQGNTETAEENRDIIGTEIEDSGTTPFFAGLSGGKRTFAEKLSRCDKVVEEHYNVVEERYNDIREYIGGLDKVTVRDCKYHVTFRKKNAPLALMQIKGKTLNVYFALAPEDFASSKYIFTDCSEVAAYKNYPMRVKVTSARMVKWVKELALLAANKM